MYQLLMSLAAVVITLTVVSTVYTIAMLICGTNVVTLFTNRMPIITMQHTPVYIAQQSTVRVSDTRLMMQYRKHMNTRLIEYGIDVAVVEEWTTTVVGSALVVTHK